MRFDVKRMTEEELNDLCEKYRNVQSGVSSDDYFRALNELQQRHAAKKLKSQGGGDDVVSANIDYVS